MNQQSMVKMLVHIGLLVLLALIVTACGDDGRDGADGAPGPQGPPAPEVSTAATALTVSITSVTISDNPVVNFTVKDQDNLPLVDLIEARFMLAKLIPSVNGDPSYWQSYINRVEEADGNGPGTEDVIQATQDRDGELSNLGDGSYSYRFATDISTVTEPLTVPYEPELSHRLAIQISGNDLPAANAVYTWRPADGATSDIAGRDIVSTANCNSCHNALAEHGGGRLEIKMCVTCHNPGSRDANSGNSVDFTEMVHKIHRGADLPSVAAGGEYAIWGFRDSKHDYSRVHLPMDIRHCSKCHDENDPEAPDGGNWQQNPSIEACGSCHDDVDFALGQDGGHAGGVMTDNTSCTVCHKEGGFVGSIAQSHQINSQLAAENFQYNILEITNTAPGEFPQVTFSVTNPVAGDAAYDILNDAEFTAAAGASRLVADIAWSTKDYSNEGSETGIARATAIDLLTEADSNGDGTFTATSSLAIPQNQTGSGALAIEGHPATDIDGDGEFTDRVPVAGTLTFFAITDAAPMPRREIVSLEKCLTCHVNLSLHGSNRNDNIGLCLVCHNAANTDYERRPADPADGLAERSVDMKRMIHSIHAADMLSSPYILYGFGSSAHDYSQVHYPAPLDNCEACHLSGTYQLPLSSTVLGSTIDSGADKALRSDDIKITPIAAACSSCHDDPLSRAHMEQNGGASFNTSQQAIDDFEVVETCVFCHGPGGLSDIATVHNIQSRP